MTATDSRILFFADAPSIHTQRWVAEMAARGHDCVVVTRRQAVVPGASQVIEVQPGLDALGWWTALPAVRRLARSLAPRWVHGHYVTSYGLWAAASGVAPVVLTAWGSDILVTPRQSRVMRALVGWTLRRAALITADSQDMLSAIATYRPQARLEEILWGADTDHFVPSAKPPEGFTVVSLRSWEPNYHIDVLIKAFARAVRARPGAGWRLCLLGGGPQAEGLKALVAGLAIAAPVDFVGRVNDAEMVQAMQGASVSVSVPRSDATSVSLLESLACGLPVVVSDLPANRQWVGQDNGWIVPAGDVEALAHALVAALDDPARRQRMAQANRALAAVRASRRVQMDRMAALYQTLPVSRSGVMGAKPWRNR